MIPSLRTPHGPEVWINQKLAETIEDAFKEALGTDTLYYYCISCEAPSIEAGCQDNHKTVWFGPISLIDYIRKVQHTIRRRYNAPILGVTSCTTKAEWEKYMDEEGPPLFGPSKDYWIGDCNRKGEMMCGDELFIFLWDRLWNKATKGSKTKKRSIWG